MRFPHRHEFETEIKERFEYPVVSKRVFAIDIETCRECEGKLQVAGSNPALKLKPLILV